MNMIDRLHNALARAKDAPRLVLHSGVRRWTQLVLRTKRRYALAWKSAYHASVATGSLTERWGGKIGGLLLLTVLGGSIALASTLEPRLQFLGDKDHLSAFQQLLTSLGGALLGATAIAFSLIMFAMQINVDRMPYGLFRKLGSDLRLLFAFVVTFVLAVGIASLSLSVEEVGVARSLALAAWGAVLTLLLFLYAYRRALALISPHEQLRIVRQTAVASLQRWVARAKRMAPLLPPASTQPNAEHRSGHGPQMDSERMAFFIVNPRWTEDAFEALNYAIAFARRFSERGDHEVAATALTAAVAINASYVWAKGRTFMAENYLIENPLTSDRFINHTLEQLRQNAQVGLARGDERQVQDTYRTLAALVQVYLQIAYAGEIAAKTHAYLAAGYLAGAVKATTQHDLPDVLMEGIRLMGEAARQQLALAEPESVVTGSKSIGEMALVGVVRANQVSVTACGAEQLTRLSLALLQYTGNHDSRFAIREVRGDVFNLAAMVVEHLRDSSLTAAHRHALSSYFSLTGMQTFAVMLSNVVNDVGNAQTDNKQAQRIVGNIVYWADRLYDPYKELLLAAIAKRSSLTHELITWASYIAKLLLALSCAQACKDHNRDELRKSASWLISSWSWIPDDRENVSYLERHSLADVIFNAAADAHQRDCNDFAQNAFKLLMQWAFKSGRYQTGWASLENALCGAAALCVLGVVSEDELMRAIDGQLQQPNAPAIEIRCGTADRIDETAGTLHRHAHAFSNIDSALGSLDAATLEPLLGRVAERLIPEVRQG